MLGGLPMLQECSQTAIADGAVVHMPGAFKELRLVKLIPAAGEIQYWDILIHQDIFRRRHAC